MDDLVSPAAQAPTAPEPTEPEPQAAAPKQTLPPELLKLPVFQALIAGSPAAVSLRLKGREDQDEIKLVKKNMPLLQSAGFGFYRSLSGEIAVTFNQLYIHPEDIIAADKAGKLEAIAPPADAVAHSVAKSGLSNPVLQTRSLPGGLATQKGLVPPQSAGGQLPVPQSPGAVQRKLATARVLNMQAGGPTTGPSPGAGRLLNTILKPVV